MSSPLPLTRLAWALAASLGLSLIPGGKYVVLPIQLFTTWVHECCHALAAIGMGGTVERITLSPDASGLTRYRLAPGRFRQAFVASAGYLGSSAVGCLLLFLSQSPRFAHQIPHLTLGIGALLGVSLIFWVRGPFGMICVAGMAYGEFALGRGIVPWAYGQVIFAFLALQTALNSLMDIRVLFAITKGAPSDARTLEKLLGLPAAFWACLWLGLSGAMVFWTLIQSIGLPRL